MPSKTEYRIGRSPFLAIGPMNAASQGTIWAHALAQTGTRSASLAHDGRVARLLKPSTMVTARADRSLSHYRLTPRVARRLSLRSALRDVTHLLNEGNMAFAADPRSASFADEVSEGAFGERRIGVIFHGTDGRDPELAMQNDSASFFYDADADWRRLVGAKAERNRKEVADLGIPTFVTTPDMLRHIEGSRLLPISVDISEWSTAAPALRRRTPRVLHRPSGARSTKGTKYILPVLETLAAAGRIELVTPSVVPRATMADLISTSDIVVDQLQSGTYGVTGVEAMAAGRLMVANISAHYELSASDLPPAVHATPTTFASAMEEVLESRDEMRARAIRGPKFVQKLHDGTAAAQVLTGFVSGH